MSLVLFKFLVVYKIYHFLTRRLITYIIYLCSANNDKKSYYENVRGDRRRKTTVTEFMITGITPAQFVQEHDDYWKKKEDRNESQIQLKACETSHKTSVVTGMTPAQFIQKHGDKEEGTNSSQIQPEAWSREVM